MKYKNAIIIGLITGLDFIAFVAWHDELNLAEIVLRILVLSLVILLVALLIVNRRQKLASYFKQPAKPTSPAFTPAQTLSPDMRNRHIGKRGLLGIVLLILGLVTFIGAKKSAADIIQGNGQSFMENRADDALASGAGHGSMEDYMADQNRSSGLLFMCIGTGLIVLGYKKYYNSPRPPK